MASRESGMVYFGLWKIPHQLSGTNHTTVHDDEQEFKFAHRLASRLLQDSPLYVLLQPCQTKAVDCEKRKIDPRNFVIKILNHFWC